MDDGLTIIQRYEKIANCKHSYTMIDDDGCAEKFCKLKEMEFDYCFYREGCGWEHK